jgi:hypothetical protein
VTYDNSNIRMVKSRRLAKGWVCEDVTKTRNAYTIFVGNFFEKRAL